VARILADLLPLDAPVSPAENYYYCLTWDALAAKRHPEWRILDRAGKPVISSASWRTALNVESGLERLFPSIAQRHYTGFENVTCVARLLALKQAQSTRTLIRFARDMTMRDVGAGNLILLGSKQSNPWVSLFESKLNFRFDYQNLGHRVYIVNRAPQPGEEAEYWPSALDALSREIYGGIAFLPNVNRESNVLILQGTSMAGPEVALEVLDNPALLRDLVRRVGTGRREGELPYFEALIRTRTLNGVASESAIIASRVLGE